MATRDFAPMVSFTEDSTGVEAQLSFYAESGEVIHTTLADLDHHSIIAVLEEIWPNWIDFDRWI